MNHVRSIPSCLLTDVHIRGSMGVWLRQLLIFFPSPGLTKKGTKLRGKFSIVRKEHSGTCTDQWWVNPQAVLLWLNNAGIHNIWDDQYYDPFKTRINLHTLFQHSQLEISTAKKNIPRTSCTFFVINQFHWNCIWQMISWKKNHAVFQHYYKQNSEKICHSSVLNPHYSNNPNKSQCNQLLS